MGTATSSAYSKHESMPKRAISRSLCESGSYCKVVEKCGIIYSMLSTPEAASDVFYDATDGVLAGLSEGKSLVDCATLQVEVSVEGLSHRGRERI